MLQECSEYFAKYFELLVSLSQITSGTFSNIFRSFLAPFIPEKLLFETLVSTVSMCSKPGYGQICGQKPLPQISGNFLPRSRKRFSLCHCSLQSSFNQVISACKNCTAINKEKRISRGILNIPFWLLTLATSMFL